MVKPLTIRTARGNPWCPAGCWLGDLSVISYLGSQLLGFIDIFNFSGPCIPLKD